jgi:hypothetical protein
MSSCQRGHPIITNPQLSEDNFKEKENNWKTISREKKIIGHESQMLA